MYVQNTVLTLKTPREPDDETGEEFPYNRVIVIGESPISHTHKGDWTGADAAGVMLRPLSNFGANLDEPFGKLRALYDVESIPEEEIALSAPRVAANALPKVQRGPTPEEVFQEQAPGTPPEEGQVRGRTPFTESPLGEVTNPATRGPLD